MQFDKGNVINKMWQMQCDKHNVKSVIWQMKCDRIKCNKPNKMWKIHCEKAERQMKYEKCCMTNALW